MKSQKDCGGNEIDFGPFLFCFACTLLIDCARKRFPEAALGKTALPICLSRFFLRFGSSCAPS